MKLTAVLKLRYSGTAAMPCGLNGRDALQAEQRVEDEEAADMKQQHGDRVAEPALLAGLVDSAEAIESDLDRP